MRYLCPVILAAALMFGHAFGEQLRHVHACQGQLREARSVLVNFLNSGVADGRRAAEYMLSQINKSLEAKRIDP